MKIYSKPPINKVKKTVLINRQESVSPIRKIGPAGHMHHSSTPVPAKSPSPTRGSQKLLKKTSLGKINYSKIDLRKGIFSSKQNLIRNVSEKNILRNGESPVPMQKGNRYHFLSKEFKIDRNLIHQKKINLPDDEVMKLLTDPHKIFK